MTVMQTQSREAILSELWLASQPRIPALSAAQRAILRELRREGEMTASQLVKALRQGDMDTRNPWVPKAVATGLSALKWNVPSINLHLLALLVRHLTKVRDDGKVDFYSLTKLGQRAAI